ncbi:A/G-specific adenine glycosylase [Nitrospina sp. 32_T5]|uniref:A/G-specific adenine glycosylase n=1 Tax=unclassified Nitrospina TaxID=2638683 RepID=UPI003F9E0311
MKTSSSAKTIQRALLTWFDTDQRAMPWRETRDPYRIWVSEIMLQQTQVKTVIPYYERWVKTFPTVEKLARARESTVLKHWEGLGYYSRARNLHKAARQIVREHNGNVPDTLEGILSLPGIGRYTAGAVLSIAYDQPLPVLDGNVKRVLSRLFGLMENGATKQSENILWEHAESLLPQKRPGDFNQSLMELGATLCLPQNPMCLLCPVVRHCEAHRQGEPEKFPPPKQRAATKKIEVSAAIIQREGKVFIQQRPREGLMGGLWEFPGGKREPHEDSETCLVREIREELGVNVAIREKVMTIRHAYTRFRVTLHVFDCTVESGRLRPTHCEQWRWVPLNKLDRYTFPAANVKIVNHLMQNGGTNAKPKRSLKT